MGDVDTFVTAKATFGCSFNHKGALQWLALHIWFSRFLWWIFVYIQDQTRELVRLMCNPPNHGATYTYNTIEMVASNLVKQMSLFNFFSHCLQVANHGLLKILELGTEIHSASDAWAIMMLNLVFYVFLPRSGWIDANFL